MAHFANKVSFSAVAMDHLTLNKPCTARKALLQVLNQICDGSIKTPFPLYEFQVSGLETAFRFMQSGKDTGKIVLKLDRSDIIPVDSCGSVDLYLVV